MTGVQTCALPISTMLTQNGVLVYLDQWDVRPGLDLPQYMETAVRNSDFVFLICTPSFANKANLGKGGVGYEKSIVTGEIFSELSPVTKFVPLLREGIQEDSLPSYLKSKVFIDFRNKEKFDESLEETLRHIYEEPEFKRPSLGSPPSFIPGVHPPHASSSNVGSEEQPFSLENYKLFFEYAESYNGLSLPKTEAKEWADKWVHGMSEEQFNSFKKVIGFATDWDGLNISSKKGAIEWAEIVVEHLSHNQINELMESTKFASNYNGLGLSKQDAYEWALNKLDLSSEKFHLYF